MPKRTRPVVLLKALVACSLVLDSCGGKSPTQPAPQQSLIVNGSFETGPRGPLTGAASIITYAGSTAITDWVVTGTNIDYYVGEAAAADSLCCVDLNGYFAAGGIAQTFATTPGAHYSVHFAMAGNPDGGPTLKQMRVSAAGQFADFSFDATGKSANNMGWANHAWEFIANSSSTTIEFDTLVQSSSAYGPMLDLVDVRLKAN
jgi:choice-of-anchor C domain-containing protein